MQEADILCGAKAQLHAHRSADQLVDRPTKSLARVQRSPVLYGQEANQREQTGQQNKGPL